MEKVKNIYIPSHKPDTNPKMSRMPGSSGQHGRSTSVTSVTAPQNLRCRGPPIHWQLLSRKHSNIVNIGNMDIVDIVDYCRHCKPSLSVIFEAHTCVISHHGMDTQQSRSPCVTLSSRRARYQEVSAFTKI